MQSEVADSLARSSKAASLLQSLVRDPWWRARGTVPPGGDSVEASPSGEPGDDAHALVGIANEAG